MPTRILILIFSLFACKSFAQKYPYTMQADLVVLVGNGVLPVAGGQIFNGVRLNKQHIETGISVGVDAYPQFNLLPVSGGVKWVPFPEKALVPYISLNAGYGFAWLNEESEEKDFHGGTVINPSFGLRIKTRVKTTIDFGVGYKKQNAVIIETRFDDLGRTLSEVNERYQLGRVSLTFGIGF